MKWLSVFSGSYALIAKWGVIVTLTAAAMGWSAMKMHQHDEVKYDALAGEFGEYKAGVKARGQEAIIRAKAQAATDKAKQEAANAENDRSLGALRSDLARLRADALARDPRGGSMSPAPAGSKCPDDQTCFDRALYQRAVGEFDSEARSGADEGSQVTVDLNSAKLWAQK